MKTYRVMYHEYRIQMCRVVTNLHAADPEEAMRLARSGQGAETERAEVHSVRAGEMTGYLDFEVGMHFLRHGGDVGRNSVTELGAEARRE